MDSDDIEIADDVFDLGLPENKLVNNRISTRFIRNDIKVSLSKNGLFNFGREIPVDLLDISSRGVLIRCHKRLHLHDKITLAFKFDCGRTFEVKATVVRKPKFSNIRYGIKFDRYNDELGDHLLETQKELIFK